MSKVGEYIKNPRKVIMYAASKGMLNWMSDESYLKLLYWAKVEKKLNLDNPQTFNEKMQWMKLQDRNPERTNLVDKYEAKKYVAEKIGAQYIIPTYGVWDSFDEIDFDSLPSQFVLKCTHDCGGIVICLDKKNFDFKAARKKLNRHLKRNYYWEGREWPYKNVKPRIIAEKYMEDESGYELKDYKLHYFDGKPRIVEVDYNRFSNHMRNFYTPDWEYTGATTRYPTDPSHQIKRPEKLEEMLELGRKLSADFPYLRVDLYSIEDKIYFGELTFYHGSGFEKFSPESYDMEVGSWLKLPADMS